MTVSGRITNKVVSPSPGPRGGDIIRFDVETKDGPRTVSQFSNKLTDEALAVLRALVVGMWADFETIENKVTKAGPNFGKVYLNIVSAVLVTQVREEGVTPPTNRVAPGVYQDPPPSTRADTPGHPKEIGDTRTRSMCVAYSKDLVVAGKVELGKLKAIAEELYQYVMTGE